MSLLLMTMALWSCGSEELIPETEIPGQEQAKTFEVKMNLGGEYVETSETPLARNDAPDAPKKYYGVNVYCMKTDGTQSSYSKYAYGVFDNLDAMKITLLGGYKYKFECTSVKDGTDKINTEENYIYYPFQYGYNSNNPDYFKLSDINKFIISPSYYLMGIKSGSTTTDYFVKSYPRTDRYYGELTDYIPGGDNTATIPMKRTVFGLNWTINAVPDGTLSWYINELNSDFSSHTGSETLEFSDIYTFSSVYNSWNQSNYSVDFTIGFTWKRSNGYNQSFSKTITVKRNVMTNIIVTLTGGSEDVSLGINEISEEMTTENVNVEFDGGTLSDTNVNPDENGN